MIEVSKPKHQKEYEHLEKNYHENYLKHHNIGFINRATRKKIKTLINKALFISFVRSGHCKDWKFFQIANLLDYIFNYFIDPSKDKISKQEIYTLCEDQFYKSLPNLPDDPKDVPTSTKIKLPFALPIAHPKNTSLMAGALRSFYKFDLLPHTYFLTKTDLPDLPTDLPTEFKKIFPIRDPKLMGNLKDYIDNLKNLFYVPNRLPDTYFALPPKKKNLPIDFRDLPIGLACNFPVNNDIKEIKRLATLLRNNNFYVYRIPIDWIKRRVPLPPAHWFMENNEQHLPITEQDQVKDFIENLLKRFTFNLPLDPDWIDSSLNQKIKPTLPEDINILAKEFNFQDKLNKDLPNFDQIMLRGIAGGSVLTNQQLLGTQAVQRGQTVTLVADAGGISVRMAGRALAIGLINQRIRVENLSSGKIVWGLRAPRKWSK